MCLTHRCRGIREAATNHVIKVWRVSEAASGAICFWGRSCHWASKDLTGKWCTSPCCGYTLGISSYPESFQKCSATRSGSRGESRYEPCYGSPCTLYQNPLWRHALAIPRKLKSWGISWFHASWGPGHPPALVVSWRTTCSPVGSRRTRPWRGLTSSGWVSPQWWTLCIFGFAPFWCSFPRTPFLGESVQLVQP